MKFPDKYRISNPFQPVINSFDIPFEGRNLTVMATDWGCWQQVSVSLPNRCPNWREMCFVKDLFWDENEECIQFHPKKSDYVNLHEYTLHMWKPPIEVGKMLEMRMDQ
jgi:hypothetical protein